MPVYRGCIAAVLVLDLRSYLGVVSLYVGRRRMVRGQARTGCAHEHSKVGVASWHGAESSAHGLLGKYRDLRRIQKRLFDNLRGDRYFVAECNEHGGNLARAEVFRVWVVSRR